LRLQIHRTPLDEFLHGIISHLPNVMLRFLTPLFPRWVLPQTFILKKQKPDWDEEFENEKRMYAKLSTLQGSTIPVCFGEASVEGHRALVLSDVGPISLCDPPALRRERSDILPMVDDALRALTRLGIDHDDIKLDNFHLVSTPRGDKVMIVDLESAYEIDPDTAPERAMVHSANQLIRYWKDAVKADSQRRAEIRRRRAEANRPLGVVRTRKPEVGISNLQKEGGGDAGARHKALGNGSIGDVG
jgi:hypothetical protein